MVIMLFIFFATYACILFEYFRFLSTSPKLNFLRSYFILIQRQPPETTCTCKNQSSALNEQKRVDSKQDCSYQGDAMIVPIAILRSMEQ